MTLTNAERQAAFRNRGNAARRALISMHTSLREGIALAAAARKRAELDGHDDVVAAQDISLEKLWTAYDLLVRAL